MAAAWLSDRWGESGGVGQIRLVGRGWLRSPQSRGTGEVRMSEWMVCSPCAFPCAVPAVLVLARLWLRRRPFKRLEAHTCTATRLSSAPPLATLLSSVPPPRSPLLRSSASASRLSPTAAMGRGVVESDEQRCAARWLLLLLAFVGVGATGTPDAHAAAADSGGFSTPAMTARQPRPPSPARCRSTPQPPSSSPSAPSSQRCRCPPVRSPFRSRPSLWPRSTAAWLCHLTREMVAPFRRASGPLRS